MVAKLSYHLLISNGGEKCICIFETPRNTNFTDEQKIRLEQLYGDYIVQPILEASLECYYNLDIIDDINEFLDTQQKEPNLIS